MIIKLAVLMACALYVEMMSAAPGVACAICVPYPKTTLADILIKADSVIMARENPEKPYFFTPVEILRGSADEDGFEAFIDSSSRRRLRLNSEHVVILLHRAAEAGWKYAAYADTEYQDFIKTIVKRSGGWQESKKENDRIAFFAKQLNHDHRYIREQAYIEVGRAPYSSIKLIAGSVPRDRIRGFLADWRLIEWHSLYILMLGQSRHPDDIAYIRQKLEAAARFGFKTNLSAWVTAFIEAYPDTGIEEIATLYFKRNDRTIEELEEVCTGLRVLGSERSISAAPGIMNRRRRIVNSYAVLLKHHPTMAEWVAKDLTAWRIQALVDQLAEIRQRERKHAPGLIFAVDYYLSVASMFLRLETVQ
jgi:hypothetical protein